MNEVGDLRNIIASAQKLQAEVARVRDELAQKTVAGESGGGLVRCIASGVGDIVGLTIDPALRDLDGGGGGGGAGGSSMLEDLVMAAVNAALARARELGRDEMSRITGGLPVPPGMLAP